MASTVWRGFITFGLISIPVRLFRAARAERVSFRRLYRAIPGQAAPSRGRPMVAQEEDEETPRQGGPSEAPAILPRAGGTEAQTARPQPEARTDAEPILARVQQASVRKGTDEVIAPRSIVKGYEYEKDRFVVVDREELKSIAPKTATEMEIQEFVNLAEIDPVYFETSYYVKPEEAGEKAYALLYRALQQSGLVAIAKFAMHSREHVVVVRAARHGIIAHTMYFAAEVRAEEEYHADTRLVKPKELELAETLIHSLAASFEPEKYRDTYREKLESIIAAKVQGRTPVEVERPKPAAEVVDIADALRRSLANLKKPAISEKQARRVEPAPKRAGAKKARGAGQK